MTDGSVCVGSDSTCLDRFTPAKNASLGESASSAFRATSGLGGEAWLVFAARDDTGTNAAGRGGGVGVRIEPGKTFGTTGNAGGVVCGTGVKGSGAAAAFGVVTKFGTLTGALQTGQRPDRPAQASGIVKVCPPGQVSWIDIVSVCRSVALFPARRDDDNTILRGAKHGR
jgi:hypothetical protein